MQNKDILNFVDKIQPLVTEKSLNSSGDGYVVFKAPANANKNIVKKVIRVSLQRRKSN